MVREIETKIVKMLDEAEMLEIGSPEWYRAMDGISKILKPIADLRGKLEETSVKASIASIEADSRERVATIEAEAREKISNDEIKSKREEFDIRAAEITAQAEKENKREFLQLIVRICVEVLGGAFGFFMTKSVVKHEDIRLAQVMHFEETGAISPQLMRLIESRKKL